MENITMVWIIPCSDSMKKNKEEKTNNNKDKFGENEEEESLITSHGQ